MPMFAILNQIKDLFDVEFTHIFHTTNSSGIYSKLKYRCVDREFFIYKFVSFYVLKRFVHFDICAIFINYEFPQLRAYQANAKVLILTSRIFSWQEIDLVDARP